VIQTSAHNTAVGEVAATQYHGVMWTAAGTLERVVNSYCTVGFKVFTVVSRKMVVFWVLAASITRAMEAARTSETLVNFYQTTRCYNPEDSRFQLLYGLLMQLDLDASIVNHN
jgi:hypothetical protein